MTPTTILKLIISLAVPVAVGAIVSVFTVASIPTWYAGLVKPALNPPNWIFGPVWTALYLLMGLAVFLIWQKGWQNRAVKIALIIFDLQLILNALWSIIFFSWQSPGWALVEIVLLWLAIVWTLIVFYQISKPAGYLLVPYLLWVSFAAYLNYQIWILN